jgi:predicted DCC family thiol-disulfide oxidoreductase YuxK
LDLAATLGSRLLVIYDGHCGLCNHTVQWLLARDRHDRLRFAPSSSPAVAALLTRHGFPPPTVTTDQATESSPESRPDPGPQPGPGTLLVLRAVATPAEQLFTRSTAVAVALAQLSGPWPFIAHLLRLIPRPLRDLGYRLIARWRYRIWGRLSTCPLPTPQEHSRFL